MGAENAKRDAKAEKAKKAIAIIESRVAKIRSVVGYEDDSRSGRKMGAIKI